MKEKMIAMLISSLCFIMVLTTFPFMAVGASQEPAEKWPSFLSFGTGRAGSGIHTITAGITTLMKKYIGINSVPESGSLGKLVILVHDNNLEFADLQGYGLYLAGRGMGPYKKYGPMNIRLMWKGYWPPSVYNTLRADKIMSVQQLRGKKVMCIYPGNIDMQEAGRIILEAVGMTYDDIKAISFTGRRESWPALKENRIDAFIFPQPAKGVASWLQQGNLEAPVRLISAPEKNLDDMVDKYDYIGKCKLSGETFKEITDNKDLVTISTSHYVYCNADLPSSLVYEVMKAVFGHLDELYKFHPAAKPFTDEPLVKPVIPFHPGAMVYYKKAGLWTDKLEATQQKLLKEVGASK